MKTIISNKSGETLDLIKRIMYSLQVLLVGLFIPFSFVFGISYNMPKAKAQNSISISNQNQVSHPDNIVDLSKVLSEKNS